MTWCRENSLIHFAKIEQGTEARLLSNRYRKVHSNEAGPAYLVYVLISYLSQDVSKNVTYGQAADEKEMATHVFADGLR